MSFQRKPPKDRPPKDRPPKDGAPTDAPKKYSSFSKKPASGFRAKSRPEAGHEQKPKSSFGASNKGGGKSGRDVDARKARKVLRALETARAEAIANGADLSAWETEFIGSLETRIDTYGSAFRDPYKGALEEPISNLQRVKLKEIHAKATGKEKRPGFGRAKKAAKKSTASRAGDEEQ